MSPRGMVRAASRRSSGAIDVAARVFIVCRSSSCQPNGRVSAAAAHDRTGRRQLQTLVGRLANDYGPFRTDQTMVTLAASEPTPNGHRLEIACGCGVTLE